VGWDFTSAAIELAYREDWALRPSFDDLVKKNLGYLVSNTPHALARASFRPLGIGLISTFQAAPESWERLVDCLNEVFNSEIDRKGTIHSHWLGLGEHFVRLNFRLVKYFVLSDTPSRCFSTELVCLLLSGQLKRGPVPDAMLNLVDFTIE
jgi:hypothetical protein